MVDQVEIVIDMGVDFTLGDFPEGFAASDLASKFAARIPGLRSIQITTPRSKPADDQFTYDYKLQGELDGKPWGYMFQVSHQVMRGWVGGPVVVSETRRPPTRVSMESTADLIAREIHAAMQQLFQNGQ